MVSIFKSYTTSQKFAHILLINVTQVQQGKLSRQEVFVRIKKLPSWKVKFKAPGLFDGLNNFQRLTGPATWQVRRITSEHQSK